MTLAQLKAKLTDLQSQKEQAIANVNAVMGATQAVEQLIKEWEAEGDTAPPSPETPTE